MANSLHLNLVTSPTILKDNFSPINRKLLFDYKCCNYSTKHNVNNIKIIITQNINTLLLLW